MPKITWGSKAGPHIRLEGRDSNMKRRWGQTEKPPSKREQKQRKARGALEDVLPTAVRGSGTKRRFAHGGLRFTTAGVLRGAWGRKIGDVTATSPIQTALSAGMSEASARRCQVVVGNGLVEAQEVAARDFLADTLTPERKSFVVVKRIWDEATLRISLPEDVWRQLVGVSFMEEMLTWEPHRNILKGRCSKLRPLVAQIFQQHLYVKVGSDVQERGELIHVPGKFLPRATSPYVFTALDTSFEPVSSGALQGIVDKATVFIYVVWPDSCFSQRLVATHMASCLDKALYWEAYCAGHALSIVANNALSTLDLVDCEFSLCSTLSTSNAYARLSAAAFAADRWDEFDVFVRVPPPAEANVLSTIVMRYTLLRPEMVKSFMLDADGETEVQRKVEPLRALAEEVRRFYNGRWHRDRDQHYCYDPRKPSGRCCETAEEVERKRKSVDHILLEHAVAGVSKPAKNRWGRRKNHNNI